MTRLIFVLFFFSVIGCQKKSSDSNPVVATINTEPVLLSQFILDYNRAKESLDSLSQADQKSLERIKNNTLNKIIFSRLVEQEAQRKQIVITEEELKRSIDSIQADIPKEQFQKNLTEQMMTFEEWRELHRKKLLAEKVARVSLQINTSVSDEEISEYYNTHKEDFMSEPKVRALQIYVTDESLAEDLLKRLRAGANFEETARKHSLSPEAKKGGDLGYFSKDEMIPEFNTAFDMSKNTLHPKVIKSSYGFHLLKTLDFKPSKQLSFNEAKDMIRRKLLEEREEKSYKQWLEDLLKSAKILKNQDVIAAIP